MTTPVFLLIEATPNTNQQAALQNYLAHVPAISQTHGGVPVANYQVEEAMDQGDIPGVFAVVSFPHREAIKAFFADPAYRALIPDRDLGFNHLRYFIVSEKI